jgi:hypothetical protein
VSVVLKTAKEWPYIKKAANYSGPFIFLRHLRQIPIATIVAAIASALVLFKSIVLGVV